MKVSFHANMCDQSTARIADVIRGPLKALGQELSADYGGAMEHLWIDYELIERHAELRPPFPFRFQKKVGGAVDKLTGLPSPVCENVGHYSVRPDFRELKSIPLESVVGYVFSAIYASSAVLSEKQKKLGGFDATAFRADFVSACRKLGYHLAQNEKSG